MGNILTFFHARWQRTKKIKLETINIISTIIKKQQT